MQKITPSALAIAVMLIAGSAMGATAAFTIPADKVDAQKVYFGAPAGFNKAAEVNYEDVVRATPEFKELKSVERGTGKYWILLSQASDHATRVIAQLGEEMDFDLITAKDYLGKVNPAIPAVDITEKVIDKMVDKPAKHKVRVANANAATKKK